MLVRVSIDLQGTRVDTNVSGESENRFCRFVGKKDVDTVVLLLVGDFNCILNPKDRRRDRHFRIDREIREFRACLCQTGLLDIAFIGPRYTWCNNHLGIARVWERINRAFVSLN